MKVFKFGGASVNSTERIQNVSHIMKFWSLEKVVDAFYHDRKEDALRLFEQVKQQHLTTAKYLLVTHYLPCEKKLRDFFTEIEWLLHDKPVRDYDYYYDQVVCIGELLSTAIVSHYLDETGIKNKWIDVRDIFRTDDNFRDAVIDWEFTNARVQNVIAPLFHDYDIVLTQGFIGSTYENE